MFRGRNDLAIDDKGRIMLPIKFREALAKNDETTLWLTNIDDCLKAYPTTEWLKKEQKILSTPVRTDAERNYIRFLIGGVQECPIDKQGRILVPQSLRKYAGLEKDVAILGLISHFEIWNVDRLEKTVPQGSSATEEIFTLRQNLDM
jgi:MraZ protein